MDQSKVQRWLQYIKNRRPNTFETYSKTIKRFEDTMNISLEDLLQQDDKQRIEMLEDYLNLISNLAPKTQSNYMGVVKSFLSFNRKPTRLTMKIHGINSTPTLKDEKIPEPHQVREVFNRCGNPKYRASTALIAFAGLRFATQVRLRLEDLIDFDINELKFTQTPSLIYVPAEASKNGRQYFTFLIKEGCEYLEAYLRNRRNRGENLTKKSFVIAQLHGEALNEKQLRSGVKFITKQTIGARAYVLRSYFNTSLLAAGVHPDWKRFFTGHKGDIEETYSTRKQLPDFAIQKMREAFQPAAEQLCTQKTSTKDQQRAAALTTMKVLEGYLDTLELNPQLKQSLKEMEHQLQALK